MCYNRIGNDDQCIPWIHFIALDSSHENPMNQIE